MVKIIKKEILLFVLFKSSRAFFDERKCILLNTWTEWVEQGSCGWITRKRSYKYYMCQYAILKKRCDKIFLKPELSALIGSVITKRVMKQIK